MSLTSGALAPDFTLEDQNAVTHTLSHYRGQWVLLYFYPKDDTPGCTTQACGLRDGVEEYRKAGVTVLGLSVDSVKKHSNFAKKYSLPFTLLADVNKEVVNLYDVWKEKKMMGRTYMGIIRTSFLIDPEGKIAHIFENVDVKTHAEDVLEVVRGRS